ncbi:hypothetical protein L1987_20823 [Smallanthus sonchifolius]|uniref:Uncharacterized protein n=1 Tax=Smallanthus sonchifolius TaxID=185202 RepID=A0ACB9IVP6_9ASTR|nr:hypothetical protein L1987_20823 [Smallanthus sonchifolius]
MTNEIRTAVFSAGELGVPVGFICLKFSYMIWTIPCGGSFAGEVPAVQAKVFRKEGFAGLYKGWGVSCLKAMPSSGITLMFYEAWKDIDRRQG